MAGESVPPNLLDHPQLRWLLARIRNTGDDAIAESLFDEFAAAVHAHLALIELSVLPHVDEVVRRGNKLVYLDGHWYLKRALAALQEMDRRSPAFHRRLIAACDRLEGQLMREATDLIELGRALDVRPPGLPEAADSAKDERLRFSSREAFPQQASISAW